MNNKENSENMNNREELNTKKKKRRTLGNILLNTQPTDAENDPRFNEAARATISGIVRDKRKKQALKRLGGYLTEHPWHLGFAILVTFVLNGLLLLGPYLSGKAIDAMTGGVNIPVVVKYVSIMIVFYLIAAVLRLGLSIIMINLSRKIVYKMRKQLFDHMTRLPVNYFDTHQTGDLVSRITYDIDTINTSLSVDAVQIFTSTMSMMISFGMMIAISPPLMLVFVITIPMSIIFTRTMTKITKPRFRKRSAMLGEMNGYAEEILSAGSVIKAYHQEEVIIGRFNEKNETAAQAAYRAEYAAAMMGPSMNGINNLALALISMLGAIFYVKQVLTIGNISSFILYSRKFVGPINQLAGIAAELQSAISAAERVFRVLDERPEKEDAEDAIELPKTGELVGDIELKNVCFGYEEDVPIIKNVSMHVKPGQTAAIVGSTGAGKTTIINLLMRFYDIDSGQILIDGKDIYGVKRDSLRSAFTMVLQDTWLFGGTVYENIAYAKPEATKEEVVRAAKIAGIHSFITRLRDGYDTILDEAGVNISKGQKQLLTIARAILKDSQMLILDEATSNVDTQTELKIQRAFGELMAGKTSIVIAHRLSTIKNADVIFVFEHGEIVEKGRHEELLAKGGAYARMYNSQFS